MLYDGKELVWPEWQFRFKTLIDAEPTWKVPELRPRPSRRPRHQELFEVEERMETEQSEHD